MNVLGIDPGYAITGWGCLKKEAKVRLLEYGCIRTGSKLASEKRLQALDQQLQKVIDRYHPGVVAIEKLFFNTNAKTALKVGEARGVIKLVAARNSLPVREFTPLQVKTSVAGYGRAEKKQVQTMIKTLLNLKVVPRPDDAADAIAVALTYCYHHQDLES